jgi:hypothetical protein
VGGTYGTHGRCEESVRGFGGKTRRKETTRKTGGVDGRLGSEWFLGRLAGGVEWMQLAHDRDRWRALVTDEPADSGATELVSLGNAIEYTCA